MGEAAKNEGKKKPAATKKTDVGAAAVVLKLNLNCEGCAEEVKRAVKNMDGVEKVTTDCEANEVTVTGKVDASAIKEKLEQKTKKKVEIVSPQPKKVRGGDKKAEKPAEKKPDEKKPAEDKKPKEAAKNEGKKKPAATKKTDVGAAAVVLKLNLNCEGCADEVKRAVKNMDGVEKVTTDCEANEVTVTGKVDASAIKEKLEQKTKKKVEIVSPQPKKDRGGDKKAKENRAEKKKKPAEDKKPKQITVVLKIRLHCEGCLHNIRRIISEFKGVESVDIDLHTELATVKGTMAVTDLLPRLKELKGHDSIAARNFHKINGT